MDNDDSTQCGIQDGATLSLVLKLQSSISNFEAEEIMTDAIAEYIDDEVCVCMREKREREKEREREREKALDEIGMLASDMFLFSPFGKSCGVALMCDHSMQIKNF